MAYKKSDPVDTMGEGLNVCFWLRWQENPRTSFQLRSSGLEQMRREMADETWRKKLVDTISKGKGKVVQFVQSLHV